MRTNDRSDGDRDAAGLVAVLDVRVSVRQLVEWVRALYHWADEASLDQRIELLQAGGVELQSRVVDRCVLALSSERVLARLLQLRVLRAADCV